MDAIERLRRKAQNEATCFTYRDICNDQQKEIESLRQQLAECERDAHDLWMMLDNIDTIDDMARHDEKLYRAMVRKEHSKRFDDRFKWVMNYIDALAKVGAGGMKWSSNSRTQSKANET